MSNVYNKEFVKIAFAPEAAFKTQIVAGAISGWIGILQDDQDLPWPEADYRQLYTAGAISGEESVGALPFTTIEGKKSYQGRLAWHPQNGQLFENIFGKKSTQAAVPAGIYDHAFSAGSAGSRPLPSFTLLAWVDVDDDNSFDGTNVDSSVSWAGCRISSTTFTFTEGEELKIESDVFATTATLETTFPPSGTTPTGFTEIITKPYIMSALGESGLTLFGAPIARIKSGSITLNHNLEEHWYGTAEPYDLIGKRVTIECSLTVHMEDETIFDAFITGATANSPTKLGLLFSRGTDDTLTLKSDGLDTSTVYPNVKPSFGGGEGPVEAEISLTLENFIAEVRDNNATYPLGI